MSASRSQVSRLFADHSRETKYGTHKTAKARYGVGFQAKVLKTFQVVSSSLRTADGGAGRHYGNVSGLATNAKKTNNLKSDRSDFRQSLRSSYMGLYPSRGGGERTAASVAHKLDAVRLLPLLRYFRTPQLPLLLRYSRSPPLLRLLLYFRSSPLLPYPRCRDVPGDGWGRYARPAGARPLGALGGLVAAGLS